MSELEARQAERSGDLKRAAYLKCQRDDHWWSEWSKRYNLTLKSVDVYALLGVNFDANGTCNYMKSRECFWCSKKQRRIYILKFFGSSSKEIASLTSEF